MLAGGREAALKALSAWRKSGAWSENYLDNLIEKEKLDKREAALASRICFGVLQNMMLCDYVIERFCTIGAGKIQPVIMDILRISVYQIMLMDKIPEHAIVSESVNFAKKYANVRASGFVNGILRSIIRNRNSLFDIDEKDSLKLLSIKYSHPVWLVREFVGKFGLEGAERLMAANNTSVKTQIHVNRLNSDVNAVKVALLNENVQITEHPYIKGCFEISGTGNMESLSSFKEGRFYVQDAAAYMSVMAANPKPGMTVIDGCSAPGGKSFTSAVFMENRGSILSCDIHKKKLRLITDGARRLGIDIIKTQAADGRVYDEALEQSADLVIADVPCSGMGVIRKKPDIRYKNADEIKGLPEIQYGILKNLARYVRPGGTLLYSTCTVIDSENHQVTDRFLRETPDFYPEDFILPCPEGESSGGEICLLPHIQGTDGFYICKMRRKI